MDTKLIAGLTDYMQKSASLRDDIARYVRDAHAYTNKQTTEKTASSSVRREKVIRLTHALTQVKHASTGRPIVEGEPQIKQAEALLSNPDTALDLLHLVLGNAQAFQKAAYVEPGSPADVPGGTTELDSFGDMYLDVTGKSPY